MGNASALAGLLLLFGATASPAGAQTANVDGSYAKLSTGNAKIARALHDAQVRPPQVRLAETGAATGTGTSQPKPLTLDQIAAQRASGHAWGQIFQSMRAQGLVLDKNLGQVVSRYQRLQKSDEGEPSASISVDGDRRGSRSVDNGSVGKNR